MRCPVCGEQLREIERYGVRIDICPACKGVWLDAGELEKIARLDSQTSYGRDDYQRRPCDDDDDDDDRPRYDENPRGGRRTRRRSFLSDLMEGFGD